MTDAARRDILRAMQAFLVPLALAFVTAPAAVAAETPLIPVVREEAAPPSALAPLAADSPWTARFEAAADELLPALRSLDETRWAPLLGGQWLGASDRVQVSGLLHDRDSPFRHALFAKGLTRRAILGWRAPATLTADEQAAIAAQPEAEAIVCWSGHDDAAAHWPQTAAEADNRPGRPYACARITYSIRGATPTWRAFIEREDAAVGEAPAAR